MQVLSSSVVDSLKFCRQRLRFHQFQNSHGTEFFLCIMDRLFNILNASSPNDTGWKKPITANGFEETVRFLSTAERYIQSLTNDEGSPRIQTQRNMGFIGLLMNINAMENLISDKIVRRKWKCILPYKFSQDHLELLFNIIRGAGQYKTLLKLLYHACVFLRVLFGMFREYKSVNQLITTCFEEQSNRLKSVTLDIQ